MCGFRVSPVAGDVFFFLNNQTFPSKRQIKHSVLYCLKYDTCLIISHCLLSPVSVSALLWVHHEKAKHEEARAMASGTRNRNLTRKFIFLRWVDPLRVPPARTLDALERSGRVKDVVFSNNSTKDVTELLIHAFQQQLVVADMPR